MALKMIFSGFSHFWRTGMVLATAGLFCAPLFAQVQMLGSGPAGAVRIFNTDAAVLESQEARQDLPCTVVPIKPVLGFDMRFHAGYDVVVPLRELAGNEDMLTMVFRVIPDNRKEEPVYFIQRIRVPSIEEDAKGDAYLQGTFDVGEGKYHVDWLMRDRAERVCSSYWDVDASLPARDKQLDLTIPPATIEASEKEPFRDEPPVEREQKGEALNVKVLINFAPQNSRAATLQPLDTNALVSILRSIAREPRIRRFSIVAFNLQEQRVIYRQDNADQVDFPSLGDALQTLNLGTVDLQRLGQKRGDTEFLTKLITDEMSVTEKPDAIIFAGPKAMVAEGISRETLKEVGDLEYPVFYMNYNFNPQSNPWRDAIGNAVKFFKGEEYTISRPRDLFYAWKDIMTRIVTFKFTRRSAASTSR
jgi:hypothetical protein